MNDELQNFIDGLQDQIFEETRASFGDATFERWLHPQYMGVIDNPDGYACISGPCGDTMEIFLKIEHEFLLELG